MAQKRLGDKNVEYRAVRLQCFHVHSCAGL